jgi:hypothetical protein
LYDIMLKLSYGQHRTRGKGHTPRPWRPLALTSKHRHADADAYVFVNAKNGGPIDQSEWPKDQCRATLRATGIRPRKFYATRHTFISVARRGIGGVRALPACAHDRASLADDAQRCGWLTLLKTGVRTLERAARRAPHRRPHVMPNADARDDVFQPKVGIIRAGD